MGVSKFTVHVLLTTASYPDCALTGTLPHGPRDYYGMRYVQHVTNAIRDANTSRIARMRYRYAMRIGYAPHESDVRRVNTLRAVRMRYAVRKYATGRANAICVVRIRYAIRE